MYSESKAEGESMILNLEEIANKIVEFYSTQAEVTYNQIISLDNICQELRILHKTVNGKIHINNLKTECEHKFGFHGKCSKCGIAKVTFKTR